MSDDILVSRLEGNKLVVEAGDEITEYDSKFLIAAVLVYVARGNGQIEPEESARMIDLIEDHFKMQGAETLELLTRAISELDEEPELVPLLCGLGPTLSDADKEDLALMGLKVVAADGKRHVAEMEQFSRAMEAIGVSPEIVHRAFDRYFAETMPGL
ncbi:MAG TPA: TerB family tellurite resistance protein [Woeseiaceae bacterium]|nr:TerB family tellurite resistance protein [Woeseiaceae bacterium]